MHEQPHFRTLGETGCGQHARAEDRGWARLSDHRIHEAPGEGPGADPPLELAPCSSPPCMLLELGPDYVALPETGKAASPPRASDARQDWEEVRLWRKAKRAVLTERRLALAAEERARKSDAITLALSSLLPCSAGALIGFYWPFKGEYDPRPLVRRLHAEGFRFALPVVAAKAKPLVFREWWPGATMEPGVWSIPVPAKGQPVEPDILLVPLIGFDARRYRLGYGGGYYDRTLAAMPVKPRAVGIGYDRLEVRTIHPQPHDVPMNVVVTESRVIRP